MKVLLIDNYDSFTFNLYQYVGELLQREFRDFVLDVFRNDEITLEEIEKIEYDRIILSPGPGDPSDKAYFGVCADVLTKLGKTTPVLGVCLGMQGMAHYFGGKVIKARVPMHGKTSIIKHDAKGVFKGLPQDLEVMRYHSLIVDRKTLPDVLEVTAIVFSGHPERSEGSLANASSNTLRDSSATPQNDMGNGEIMGLRHKTYPVEGIQFHPESFATEAGKQMIKNFLFK